MSNKNSSYSPNNWPTTGTQVSAPMIPPGGGNTGGLTHYAKYGHGGYRSVETKSELNDIALSCLELGMMVNVINDDNVNNNGLWILDSIDGETRNWKKLDINSDELNIGTVTKYETDPDGVSTVELGQSIINGGFDYSDSNPDGNMIGTKGWYVDAAWVEREQTDMYMYTPVRYMNDRLSPNRLQIELSPHQITDSDITYHLPITYENDTGTYNFITSESSNVWRATYENTAQPITYNINGNSPKISDGSCYELTIPLKSSNNKLVKVECYYDNTWHDLNYDKPYTWYAYLHCANSYPNIFLPGVNDVNYPPESTRVKQYDSREAFFNAFENEQDHINIYDGANKDGLIDSLVGKAISYFPRFGSTDAVAEWNEDNKCVEWLKGVETVDVTDPKEGKLTLLRAKSNLKQQSQIALKLESYKNKNGVFENYSTDSNNILRVSSLANTSYTWNGIPPSLHKVYQYFFSYIKGLYGSTTYSVAHHDEACPQYFAKVDRGSPNGNCINIIDEPLVGGMDIYTDVYVFGLDANKTAGNSNMTVGKENKTYQSFGLAVGRGNSTIGYANFTAGKNNKVGGEYSAAIGDDNTTLSSNSYAIGNGNKVGNTKSNKHCSYDIAIGKGLDLTNDDDSSGVGGRVAVGRYNKNEPNSIFVVGSGAQASRRFTAFEVTTSGLTKANNGLEVTKGNLKITDGYLNMRVFKYNDDGTTSPTSNYASIKLIAYDNAATTDIVEDDLVLNIVDVQSIATLAGNATVNDSITMNVYRTNGDSTNKTASLQCVQLGENDNAQYSLRIFS